MDEWRMETIKMATRKRREFPRREAQAPSDWFSLEGEILKPQNASSQGTEAIVIPAVTGHGSGRRA